MKVTRTYQNRLITVIRVEPWPDFPFGASVEVIAETGQVDLFNPEPPRTVRVRYSTYASEIKTAREWAEALLRACDIAEQIERDGGIVLEGEEVPA